MFFLIRICEAAKNTEDNNAKTTGNITTTNTQKTLLNKTIQPKEDCLKKMNGIQKIQTKKELKINPKPNQTVPSDRKAFIKLAVFGEQQYLVGSGFYLETI